MAKERRAHYALSDTAGMMAFPLDADDRYSPNLDDPRLAKLCVAFDRFWLATVGVNRSLPKRSFYDAVGDCWLDECPSIDYVFRRAEANPTHDNPKEEPITRDRLTKEFKRSCKDERKQCRRSQREFMESFEAIA